MARRFARPRFRRSRQNPNYHWAAAVDLVNTTSAGQLDEIVLINEADYASNTNISPTGVTLVRLLVAVAVGFSTPVAIGRHTFSMALVAVDTDEAAVLGGNLDPEQADTYIDERVLWFKTFNLTLLTAVGEYNGEHSSFMIDCRQKVRLKGNAISLLVKNNAASANTIFTTTIARALLKGDIT